MIGISPAISPFCLQPLSSRANNEIDHYVWCDCSLCAGACVHTWKGEVVYKGSIELEKENVNFYHATAQPFCISQKISPEVAEHPQNVIEIERETGWGQRNKGGPRFERHTWKYLCVKSPEAGHVAVWQRSIRLVCVSDVPGSHCKGLPALHVDLL